MDDGAPDDGWSSLSALPEAERGDLAEPFVTLDVDGERFALRAAALGGTHYAWLTGPNDGYGFTSSAPADSPPEQHTASIRGFLDLVDPVTGFIQDD